MKSAASTMLIAYVLIGLCASLAECTIRQREVAYPVSTGLHKRQARICSDERYNETLQNLPAECTSSLMNFEEGTCDLECFSMGCSDTCAEPLYDYFVECHDDSSTATRWEIDCSRSANGDFCYDVVDDVIGIENSLTCFPSICTGTCTEAYRSGCCFYSLFALAGDVQGADRLWNGCNVDIPGVCTSRFTGEPIKVPGSGATLTSYISVLVVGLLMAATSLN